jgi:hypothetical protein
MSADARFASLWRLAGIPYPICLLPGRATNASSSAVAYSCGQRAALIEGVEQAGEAVAGIACQPHAPVARAQLRS